jgi:hypothetical protein
VKPFQFSEDGFTLIDLLIGDEREFGSMTDGLVAEGYIEPIDAAVAADPTGERAAVRARRK